MSVFIRALILGGIEIPLDSVHSLNQVYDPRDVSSIHHMGDGGIQKQTLAGTIGKIKTSISGSGTIPVGLQGVTFSGPLLLKCHQHRAISSATRVITLPAARRGDTGSEPYGRAYVGNEWVATGIGVVGNTATLDEVTGATQYQAVYFPEITVIIEGGGPRELRARGNKSSWSMTCWEQ